MIANHHRLVDKPEKNIPHIQRKPSKLKDVLDGEGNQVEKVASGQYTNKGEKSISKMKNFY